MPGRSRHRQRRNRVNAAKHPPQRIALTGLLDEHGGSLSGSAYRIARAMLERGIDIDFYADPRTVPEPTALVAAGMRFIDVSRPRSLAVLDRLPRSLLFVLSWLAASCRARTHARRYARAIGNDAYDALISFGVPAPVKLRGVPTLTWSQGAPGTELRALLRLRRSFSSPRDRLAFALASVYYCWRGPFDRRQLAKSDVVVVGSQWTVQQLIDCGFPPDRVRALPYAVDLGAFDVGTAVPDFERPLLLHLGRLDPRKRVDLLVAAFSIVRSALPGARLQIVGRPGWAGSVARCIATSTDNDAIEYVAGVPPPEVPDLLKRAAILVQPSENEDFGSSVAEALCAGVPVVIGPSNGTGDYIDSASARFRAYTAESVAAAILEVARRGRADPIGVRESARSAAVRWFDPGRVADELLGVVMEARAALALTEPTPQRPPPA